MKSENNNIITKDLPKLILFLLCLLGLFLINISWAKEDRSERTPIEKMPIYKSDLIILYPIYYDPDSNLDPDSRSYTAFNPMVEINLSDFFDIDVNWSVETYFGEDSLTILLNGQKIVTTNENIWEQAIQRLYNSELFNGNKINRKLLNSLKPILRADFVLGKDSANDFAVSDNPEVNILANLFIAFGNIDKERDSKKWELNLDTLIVSTYVQERKTNQISKVFQRPVFYAVTQIPVINPFTGITAYRQEIKEKPIDYAVLRDIIKKGDVTDRLKPYSTLDMIYYLAPGNQILMAIDHILSLGAGEDPAEYQDKKKVCAEKLVKVLEDILKEDAITGWSPKEIVTAIHYVYQVKASNGATEAQQKAVLAEIQKYLSSYAKDINNED